MYKRQYYFDYVIISDGLLGLSIAQELISKFPDTNLAIIEYPTKIPNTYFVKRVLNDFKYNECEKFDFNQSCVTSSIKSKCVNDSINLFVDDKQVVEKLANTLNKDEFDLIDFKFSKNHNENGNSSIDDKWLQYRTFELSIESAQYNETRKQLVEKGVKFYANDKLLKLIAPNMLYTTNRRVLMGRYIFNAAGVNSLNVAWLFGFCIQFSKINLLKINSHIETYISTRATIANKAIKRVYIMFDHKNILKFSSSEINKPQISSSQWIDINFLLSLKRNVFFKYLIQNTHNSISIISFIFKLQLSKLNKLRCLLSKTSSRLIIENEDLDSSFSFIESRRVKQFDLLNSQISIVKNEESLHIITPYYRQLNKIRFAKLIVSEVEFIPN